MAHARRARRVRDVGHARAGLQRCTSATGGSHDHRLAIQAHGGAGLSSDFPLASMLAEQRILRLADGPDEVHNETIARLELASQLATA
ncbi:MAG TPA: acyl-CoA dehydrogenase family protein [Polyangiales bacterium]|nr:acyl-CoA dehydrogenase family protein [Polyangiales bacterium]